MDVKIITDYNDNNHDQTMGIFKFKSLRSCSQIVAPFSSPRMWRPWKFCNSQLWVLHSLSVTPASHHIYPPTFTPSSFLPPSTFCMTYLVCGAKNIKQKTPLSPPLWLSPLSVSRDTESLPLLGFFQCHWLTFILCEHMQRLEVSTSSLFVSYSFAIWGTLNEGVFFITHF